MATGNPLIDQGRLNRILGSVTWDAFPQLNVTAPFLDRDGINLRKEGEMTFQHPTMTGVVQSPEAYVMVSLVIALLKTQALSAAYQAQMQASTVLGSGTVYPDVSTGLLPYTLLNMAIQTVGEQIYNGTTPIFAVTCRGYWVVNNSLFA
jgi:hypothetical protein